MLQDEQVREESLTAEEQDMLNSVRVNRIILPMLLGLGVVAYMMWRSFQKEELPELDWNLLTISLLGLTVLLLGLRHMAYALRLRVLTEGEFTWRKCVELIFIWEFSSAITPTSVGGSGVALFVLSQEKLATGKIAAIIFYTIILDTTFFVLGLPILFLLLGTPMIFPEGDTGSSVITNSFFVSYILMLTYGSLFFYGIILRPDRIRNLLGWLTSWKFTKRFRRRAVKMASDMVTTSKEIRSKPFSYHATVFGATAAAWSIRFALVMILMIAFVPAVREGLGWAQQTLLYGRLEAMYVVLALSPTPGGTGIAEAAFGPFLRDFIVDSNGKYAAGMAVLIAFIWRLLTYYFYLLAGTIAVPNWIRGVVNERIRRRKMSK